jgi:hypothetical protein
MIQDDHFESVNHPPVDLRTTTASQRQIPRPVEPPVLIESHKQSFNIDHPEKQAVVAAERKLKVMQKKFQVVV